ncbi:MAG: ferrochelatase [Nocardiopsaceae bacterium]|nr:ferrochelatase [Nocardiopsaceae bacterium]
MRPYDAILLVSYGGPDKPADVVPFLERVTRGRGIPAERLEQVGRHYYLFGGKSPINDQNRAFLAALRADLSAAGIDIGVYWGNRNSEPFLADTVRRMAADGVRRAACLVTSAYSSYSSCRHYREDLGEAAAAVDGAPVLDKLRGYFNHPGFVEPVVDATLAALDRLPAAVRDGAHLAFVTHSIPVAMSDSSGPEGGAYTAQHRSVMADIAQRVWRRTGRHHRHALVYCSRSGPAHVPWLEPDINDHLEALHAAGAPAVVIVPAGFVSDHMEVAYDLDTEALGTAARLGLPATRAATAGTDPRFVAVARDLLLERAAAERGEPVRRASTGSLAACWDHCPAGCCASPPAVPPAAAHRPTDRP